MNSETTITRGALKLHIHVKNLEERLEHKKALRIEHRQALDIDKSRYGKSSLLWQLNNFFAHIKAQP